MNLLKCAIGELVSKPDEYFLKYAVPTSLIKANRPSFQQSSVRVVLASEPGVELLVPALMKEACWKKKPLERWPFLSG